MWPHAFVWAIISLIYPWWNLSIEDRTGHGWGHVWVVYVRVMMSLVTLSAEKVMIGRMPPLAKAAVCPSVDIGPGQGSSGIKAS